MEQEHKPPDFLMTVEKQEVAAKASSIREEFFGKFSLKVADKKTKASDTGGRLASGEDGSVVVETIDVPEYASVDEAVQKEGAEKVLSLFNTQNKTTLMNSTRSKYTGKTSNSAYLGEANNRIWNDETLKAQAQSIWTDMSIPQESKNAKYQDLLNSVIATIKKEKAGSGPQSDTSVEESD